MSDSNRLMPGAPFPNLKLPVADGNEIELSSPGWRAIFVIRGAHCSICRQYLGQIESHRSAWESKGIEILVVSADDPAKADAFARDADYGGMVAGGLDVAGMTDLGLWMTGPDSSPLGYVHAEPGFFFVDPEGNVAIAEASNLPAMRPDLEWLDNGFTYIIDNDLRPTFGSYEAKS